MLPESWMRLLNLGEAVLDAIGDGLAGTLATIGGFAHSVAQTISGRQFGGDPIDFHLECGGPRQVSAALRFLQGIA
jgi:hypothetical protein